MRLQSHLDVTVDLLSTTTEVAEVAKAAAKFGASITMRPDPKHPGSQEIRLLREEPDWPTQDLARLVYLQAMALDMSVNDVLAQVRQRLEKWDAPLDRPPSDAAGIGEAAAETGEPSAEGEQTS